MKNKTMYQEILTIFVVALVSCSIVFMAYGLKVIVESSDPIIKVDKVVYVHEGAEPVTEVRTEREFVTIEIPPTPETELTDAEIEEMARVVHSEAGNQDMIGKRLVADVILNRVESVMFPATVSEVIGQENQFRKGSEYTDEDLEAVRIECQNRLDHDVLYFRTGSFHLTGARLYQHGDHYFSGR